MNKQSRDIRYTLANAIETGLQSKPATKFTFGSSFDVLVRIKKNIDPIVIIIEVFRS